MQVTALIHPTDIDRYMKASSSVWPDMKSWINQRKNRADPLSLSEIARSGGIEFALFAGRALPEGFLGMARKIAIAMALGHDEAIKEAACTDASLADGYLKLLEVTLSHADKGVAYDKVREARLAFAREASVCKNKKAAICSQPLIAAAAPYPWGAAAVAHRRALEAIKLIASGADKERAVEHEESYHLALLHVLDA